METTSTVSIPCDAKKFVVHREAYRYLEDGQAYFEFFKRPQVLLTWQAFPQRTFSYSYQNTLSAATASQILFPIAHSRRLAEKPFIVMKVRYTTTWTAYEDFVTPLSS